MRPRKHGPRPREYHVSVSNRLHKILRNRAAHDGKSVSETLDAFINQALENAE